MADVLVLLNDEVKHIPIATFGAAGEPEAAPVGDVFSAVSADSTLINAVIATMPSGPLAGKPSLDVNSLKQNVPDPGVVVTLSDADGLIVDLITVTCGPDTAPKSVGLNLSGAVSTPQPVPAA